MKINDIVNKPLQETATAGGTTSGAIATTPFGGGVKRSQVGSLFGGTYKQPKPRRKKK